MTSYRGHPGRCERRGWGRRNWRISIGRGSTKLWISNNKKWKNSVGHERPARVAQDGKLAAVWEDTAVAEIYQLLRQDFGLEDVRFGVAEFKERFAVTRSVANDVTSHADAATATQKKRNFTLVVNVNQQRHGQPDRHTATQASSVDVESSRRRSKKRLAALPVDQVGWKLVETAFAAKSFDRKSIKVKRFWRKGEMCFAFLGKTLFARAIFTSSKVWHFSDQFLLFVHESFSWCTQK